MKYFFDRLKRNDVILWENIRFAADVKAVWNYAEENVSIYKIIHIIPKKINVSVLTKL